jgi:hypothetical protein
MVQCTRLITSLEAVVVFRFSLVIQASAQLSKWNDHVIAVCLTFLEAIIPCLHMWKGRTLDIQSEIAKQRSEDKVAGIGGNQN